MPIRYDSNTRLGEVTTTPQGYLRIPVVIGKGNTILSYKRHDGTVVREFRPSSEVSKKESLDSAKSAPATIGHITRVDSTNTNKLAKGHLGDSIEYRQDDLVRADAIITDKDTIRKIQSKELVDVSPGYDIQIDNTPGEYNGERYDRIQRSIVYNHIALLPLGQGRQGREVSLRLDSDDNAIVDEKKEDESEVKFMKVKIRLDGKDYEIEVSNDTEAQLLRDLCERNDSLQKEKDRLEGENKVLTKKAKDEKERADKAESLDTINEIVAERMDAISKLKRLNPKVEDKDVQTKSLTEIRLDAIEAAGHSRDDFKDSSESVIEGAFKVLSLPQKERKSVGGPVPKERKDAKDEMTPKQKLDSRLENAWKGKEGK